MADGAMPLSPDPFTNNRSSKLLAAYHYDLEETRIQIFSRAGWWQRRSN